MLSPRHRALFLARRHRVCDVHTAPLSSEHKDLTPPWSGSGHTDGAVWPSSAVWERWPIGPWEQRLSPLLPNSSSCQVERRDARVRCAGVCSRTRPVPARWHIPPEWTTTVSERRSRPGGGRLAGSPHAMDARQLGAYLATDDAFGQFRLSRWLCGRGALAAGQLSALVGRRVGRRGFFAAVRRASRLATVIRCPACER